jgi:hypothetical protein
MTRMPPPLPASHPLMTPPTSPVVIAGVDTHKDLHVAAVIDTGETVLATHSFSTTRAGYRALIRWVRFFGDVVRVGVEGTGSYGRPDSAPGRGRVRRARGRSPRPL